MPGDDEDDVQVTVAVVAVLVVALPLPCRDLRKLSVDLIKCTCIAHCALLMRMKASRFIDGCFDILLEHSLENLILIDQKYYKTAKLVNNTIIM